MVPDAPPDRFDNAANPSPFDSKASAVDWGRVGPDEPRCLEMAEAGECVRFAIHIRNTASDDHSFRGSGNGWRKLDSSAPRQRRPRGDLESRVEYVLPPGRWLVFFDYKTARNAALLFRHQQRG